MRSIFTCVFALLVTASAARAQPDPFSAYEMDGARGAGGVDAPLPGGDAHVMTGAGALTASAGAVFNVTHSTNGSDDGSERTNSTFFTHLAPAVGWFILDRLELRLLPGIVWRQLDRGSSGTSTDRAWLVETGARYHLVLTRGLLVYGGAVFGGYVGTSDRRVEVVGVIDGQEQSRTVREATDTAGVALGADAGLGIVLSPELLLDVGLDVKWLVGSEQIDSEDESLPTSTFNTGLAVRLRYVF